MPRDAARTDELRERALAVGFDLVRVAAVLPLDRDRQALDAWLAAGRQAGMRWMATTADRRADPERVVPGCRSVVALALNYWRDTPPPASRDSARVARYARGRDYHRVLGAKAREIATWLERSSGAPARAFVDTGPILERAWAERAGLGWIGKNANLLTRDLGSWVLLAEILTAEALVPDPGPHEEFCGSCTACLDECPTAAIVGPGVVDANLCISYWTIEHRGAIPEAMRAGIGDWLFGCDVCQDVCPWNLRFARPRSDAMLGPREDLDDLDPAELLDMDEATFRARYSGTPLMRARWQGMRRNACVVLGNRRSPEAWAVLERALGDPDPVIREHAAWAIERIALTRGNGVAPPDLGAPRRP